MRTDDRQSYISRLRVLGMSEDIIQQRLLLEGWKDEPLQIHSSAEELKLLPHNPHLVIKTETTPNSARSPVMRWLLGGVSIFALFILGVSIPASVYFFSKSPVVYSISLANNASSTISMLTYGALPALANPDYYASTKDRLVQKGASFIDANLSAMQLTVYRDGAQVLTVPILAKGKVGSWWETPAGIYKIETKETNHLSSFGDVYMPFSMDFQGNFFIHGWPYYRDGTPVATTFSGGCIRLATEDAKKVYELTEKGMPVIVYNATSSGDSFIYQLKGPYVSANEYLVADATNGTVLMSKNASSSVPIASITKLITALVATEYVNLDKKILVPPEAIVYTSVARLKPNTFIRAYDLLFLLLQESSNEAAETFAAELGRDRFVRLMNEKARAIGLTNTFFNDPSGAKDDLASPEDLFTLLRYIYENRKFVFGITTGDIQESAYGTPAFKSIGNFNKIKEAPAELLGGKVGETNQAGETYAGIFSVVIGGENRRIAVIVLGSRDAVGDVRRLLTYAHNSYAPGEAI